MGIAQLMKFFLLFGVVAGGALCGAALVDDDFSEAAGWFCAVLGNIQLLMSE